MYISLLIESKRLNLRKCNILQKDIKITIYDHTHVKRIDRSFKIIRFCTVIVGLIYKQYIEIRQI